MAKMKVFELARELDAQSKDVIAFLQDKGYEVKAAQSSVEDDAAALVRQEFGAKTAPKKAAVGKAAAEEKPAKKTTKTATKTEETEEQAEANLPKQ